MIVLAIVFSMMIIGSLYADCDMMAMIAKKGNSIGWINGSHSGWLDPDDPHDYFDFMYVFSPSNPDGYGIVYIDSDGYIPEIDFPDTVGYPTELYDPSGQAWYVVPNTTSGTYTIPEYDGPFNDAKTNILSTSNNIGIVMGHLRNATGSTIGNHPFQLLCDTNGDGNEETFMFMHNGNVSSMLVAFKDEINSIYGTDWWDEHPSNWFGTSDSTHTSTEGWIDSELYLHYLIAHVQEAGGNMMKGIYNALSNVDKVYYGSTSINMGFLDKDVVGNFVLTDGENLYLYRNSDDDNDYSLAYKEHDKGFYGVQTSNLTSCFTQLEPNSFVIITPYGDPIVFNDFLMHDNNHNPTTPAQIAINLQKYHNFISGEIDNNTPNLDLYYPKTYISGDTYVNSGNTLDLDPEVVGQYTLFPNIKFAGHYNLYIEGTLNVMENASLNLSNSSKIEVSNNGTLSLDWGSTITGSTPTTYEATKPGHQTGGEHSIPGDRIIVQNGGIITTDNNHQNPGEEITIASSSDALWDGIFIKNPGEGDDFWFVNCDISGISKLVIKNDSQSMSIAKLNLHLTDFHNAGQIIAKDGHRLTIEGSDTHGYSYIQNNSATPIIAYESPVFLDYVWIGGEGNENSGAGIYLYDSAATSSKIENSYIAHNSSDGVVINGVLVSAFSNNEIIENSGFGMLCYQVTEFTGANTFKNISIIDNGFAEYVGWQETFRMGDQNANIYVSESNYGIGSDQFLLMNVDWDGENPVDISGTNITISDLPHLCPPDPDAWIFGASEIPQVRLMLYAASSDMGNGNYLSAEQTLHQIISEYPLSQEAGSAVYYLYHLENLTDQDYDGLIDYLENIDSTPNTPLEYAIERIITKSYMKDKEYLIAIDRLETVINNSQMPDEVILAMIDQGYCYMKLAQQEEKGLPPKCTVMTTTLDEYQAKINELQTQLSFYPEEENQLPGTSMGSLISTSNYPNPFNPGTTIKFDLMEAGEVELTIYNIKGQKVKQLLGEHLPAGEHKIVWDGKDSRGGAAATGFYFYKISAGNDTTVRKMLLLK
jgi:predicted glutamine amidotransferase